MEEKKALIVPLKPYHHHFFIKAGKIRLLFRELSLLLVKTEIIFNLFLTSNKKMEHHCLSLSYDVICLEKFVSTYESSLKLINSNFARLSKTDNNNNFHKVCPIIIIRILGQWLSWSDTYTIGFVVILRVNYYLKNL